MLAARTAGFATTPTVSSLTDAAANDYLRYFTKAGVQTWAYPRSLKDVPLASGTKGIPAFLGVYFNSARGSENAFPGAETATGDPVVMVDGVAVPYRGEFTPYTFACPGDYTITASLPGTSATWKSIAHVSDAFHITNTAFYPAGTGPHPLALQNRNDGPGRPTCRAVAARPAVAPQVPKSADGGLPATGASAVVPIVGLVLLLCAAAAASLRRARR
jgi:hypothetical protein